MKKAKSRKPTKRELAMRKYIRARTSRLLKQLDEIGARINADEELYGTNSMHNRIRAIGNRIMFLERNTRFKDFQSMMIRLGQLEASMKTVQQFTQEEIGVLRRIVIAAVTEPYDVRRVLPPTS